MEGEVDTQSSRFTWTIKNFSKLNTTKLYSKIFLVGRYKCRILVLPEGREGSVDQLSIDLEVADLPCSSSRYAQFGLSVVNQVYTQYTLRKDTQESDYHQFIYDKTYNGFTSFMPLSVLHNPSKGFLVNNTLIVKAEVSIRKVVEYCSYDSKKEALYTIIKVARNEDFVKQIGRDIYFDLVDHDKVRCFRTRKQTPFNIFKEEVAKDFGIPVQFQRFWLWATRQNHTYRPDRPLKPQEETQSVEQLRNLHPKAHNAELKLFLEVELGPDFHPIQPPKKTTEDILIFFKLYDPITEELRYVGKLFVKGSGSPSEIFTKLNVMAGFSSRQEIELYEEIKFEPRVMCELIDKQQSFLNNQLEDGDIVCFQKSLPIPSRQLYPYPDVPSFLEYVHNRQDVHFRSREKPKENDFCLELSKLFNYDEVVERVTRQLGVHDPSKIRLTSHNYFSQQPSPTPIQRRGKDYLLDMLVDGNSVTSDILYYEVLDNAKAGPSNSVTQQSRPSSCVVCWNSPMEGACIPCGHMAGCMLCLNKIKGENLSCPVCRASVQQVVRIYAV